jgi:hypothetical protein
MFRASLCPSSGAKTTAVVASGLPSELGDSSVVGRGRAGRPEHDQRHCYHHVPTVKPEAPTAVVELLMMGMRMPETCWVVFKRQVINLRNCCIWLVDSYECMKMHGLANRPARPRPTALLSPSSDGSPEAATAVVVASDDGRENIQYMLNCI